MWFINLLLALAIALEQIPADAWDCATVRADMFSGDMAAGGPLRLNRAVPGNFTIAYDRYALDVRRELDRLAAQAGRNRNGSIARWTN